MVDRHRLREVLLKECRTRHPSPGELDSARTQIETENLGVRASPPNLASEGTCATSKID
jgi:hypothetical protein